MYKVNAFLVAFLQVLTVVLAAGCDAPTWTIKDFHVTFGAEVRSGGPLSFNITSSMTNQTDRATCSLRANSRCDIQIAASGLNIMFQSWVEQVIFGVNQTQICDGKPTYVTSSIEITVLRQRAPMLT